MSSISSLSGGAGRKSTAAAQQILRLISEGKVQLVGGGRLPPERHLAEDLGCSRETVRRALVILEANGDVRRRRGRGGGVFAIHPNANWPMFGWYPKGAGKLRLVERPIGIDVSVPGFLMRQNFMVSTKVLEAKQIRADATAASALELQEGDPVIFLSRIRSADKEPLSWERMILPQQRFPDLLECTLDGSMSELFRTRYQVEPGQTNERIRIKIAGKEDEPKLATTEGQPLFAITRVTRDQDGKPYEFSHDRFRADRTELKISAEREKHSGT